MRDQAGTRCDPLAADFSRREQSIFEEIEGHTLGALDRISEAEIVSWQNPPKPEYVKQAMLFMTSVDDLRQAGQKRDIRAVGDAYANLVATCVHCHFYVRDARAASLTIPGVMAYPGVGTR